METLYRWFCFTDETVYNGACTEEADSCTYVNALCGDDGFCGCEAGLEYYSSLGGCCKCAMVSFNVYFNN